MINATGLMVDEDLLKGDVRMTMGGEPTFVSIDDMEGPEWNTTADGKLKRELSHDLIFRLREKFGPSGMIHYGQGKWYPGEPLPRWQYGLFWRKDNYPIWKNIKLVAHEKIEKKYTHEHAQAFVNELAKTLAVSTENVGTAYEDIFYFLWTEGKLPANIDPLQSNLKDPIERRTLSQLLEKGLEKPVGYVLPLKWNYDNDKWQSNKWVLKRENLFLIPGNSPIGLRLPLESLAAVAKSDEPQKIERSLFDQLPELEHFHETITSRYGSITSHPDPKERAARLKEVTSVGVAEKAAADKYKKPEKKKADEDEKRKNLCTKYRLLKLHCAWRQGMASFIFFCRQWITWNIISTWWPPLKQQLQN